MDNPSPDLIDSDDIRKRGGMMDDDSEIFSDVKMQPNLVNDTSTDLKLNMLANQMKITVLPEEESSITKTEDHAATTTRVRDHDDDDNDDDDNRSVTLSTEAIDDADHRHEDTMAGNDPPPTLRKENLFYHNVQHEPSRPKLTPSQERFRKIELLRIFHELEGRGIQLSSRYTIHSDLTEMEQEYEILKSIQTKKNAVKLYKGFLINTVQAVEFLNEAYNPFDFHLKGWSEYVGTGIDDYEDVFGELYEKYKHTGRKIEPELKLLFMLVASATTFHASNTMLRNTPGLDDFVKRNPAFVNKFSKNMMKDPPKETPVPPELKTQQTMKGPNPREFLDRLKAQQTAKMGTATTNNTPMQHLFTKFETQPVPPVVMRDTGISESPLSEITSTTTRRKKKKAGITIPV